MKTIVIDLNILLDYLFKRPGHEAAAKANEELAMSNERKAAGTYQRQGRKALVPAGALTMLMQGYIVRV